MPKPTSLSVDWSKHPRCHQCDELFGNGRLRAAAIIGLKVAGVFHEHFWPEFEASSGHMVQAIVPYPEGLTSGGFR